MITLRSSFLAAAGLALSLAVGPPAAQASFSADGWQSLHPSGFAVSANRGPLAGVIICLDESLTQSIPVVVVTGGDGNAASDEANRLQYQMLGHY